MHYQRPKGLIKMAGVPIESNDDAVLKMLGGANFGPNAKLTLPSGTELDGNEAQAFTAAFADDKGKKRPRA